MRGRYVASHLGARSLALQEEWRAQLIQAHVLLPLSASKRNRAWEAAGLLDLLAELEAGE